MSNDVHDNTRFQLSADARLLYVRLSKCKAGDIIKYSELSDIIGKPIQDYRYFLETARNIARNQDGLVFGAVTNIGIKCLTDEEIISTGISETQSIHRRSKRTVKKLSCVRDFKALPPEQRLAHNAHMSVLGMLANMTKEKELTKITNQMDGSAQKVLSFERTLAMFQPPAAEGD